MREQLATQLGDTVRAWVTRQYPGVAGVADRAARVAAAAYANGATVPEACATAQAFVGSWTRHPANYGWAQRAAARGPYLKAS